MAEQYYAVIMAGGGGTRLWPLSRKSRPKQMLRVFGERTLFQIAVDRLEGLFPPERILVVTVADQAAALRVSRPEIPTENFLIEPRPRGTASVVGMAATAIHQRDPQAVMAILTADHFIENEALFRELLEAACSVAEDGFLVTLGITPTFPSVGYGYIQMGEPLGKYGQFLVYRVLRFKEKPSEDQAREMLAGGDHAWNSGMFIWRTDQILEEFRRQMPDLAEKLDLIARAWSTSDRQRVVGEIWPTIKNETIDYGIMEHARNVAVIPAKGLGWNDVGSWDSLFDVIPEDEHGNIVLGANHLSLDTLNSLVCEDGSDRLIVTIGVKDLVVVDTGDALLICEKSQAQKVKDVVNRLKQEQRSQYL
ncbi:MAG TPA: mannose-1-phosphate guanylyltransferase [Anaerolineaceae bacterium]|nr:mannose-1-phosphate guanylyltransferase [Anaerolineaceae bacterium]